MARSISTIKSDIAAVKESIGLYTSFISRLVSFSTITSKPNSSLNSSLSFVSDGFKINGEVINKDKIITLINKSREIDENISNKVLPAARKDLAGLKGRLAALQVELVAAEEEARRAEAASRNTGGNNPYYKKPGRITHGH